MQSTRLGKFTVFFNHSEEFHHIKSEIFTQGNYYIELPTNSPVMIDAGAHIGLATMYFKQLYPAAEIWAVEPVSENFQVLKKNIEENMFENVHCLEVALAAESGETTLYQDVSNEKWFSTASSSPCAWNGQQQTKPITVQALSLAELLERIGQQVDVMKMDIEGGEFAVLRGAERALMKISQMIIEFHPSKTHQLQSFVEFLEQHSFRVRLWQKGHQMTASRVKGLCYVEAKLMI